jgi:hypothetical protein
MPRPPVWPFAVAAAAALSPLIGPLRAGGALGAPCAEGPRHLWSLRVAADALWEHGPRRVAEVGWPGPALDLALIDPVSLLVFWPAREIVGEVAAWNLLYAAAVLALAVGGWALAGALALGPGASAVLAAAVVGNPAFIGFADSGRTEYLAASLWPLHLALLLRAVRGGPSASWPALGAALGAAVALALLGAGGPPVAVFAALLGLPLLLGPLRGRWSWGAAALGAALALPALLPTLAELPGRVAEWGTPQPGLDRPVQVPVAALLGLADPDTLPPTEAPAALSPALLLLALLGAARVRGARPWALVGIWGLALSVGPRAAWTEGGAELPGPAAALMRAAPPLAGVSSWSRIGHLTAVPLGVAAALGAPRHPAVAAGVAALALVNQLARPRPVDLGARGFSPLPPPGYAEARDLLPAGALLQLPLDLPNPATCRMDSRWLLWSGEGRPVTASPAGSGDGTLGGALGPWLASVQRGRPDLLRAPASLPDGARDCLRAELRGLGARGLGGVLVDVDDPRGAVQARWLEGALGPPAVQVGAWWGWDPAQAPAPAGAPDCSPVAAPRRPRAGRAPRGPPG